LGSYNGNQWFKAVFLETMELEELTKSSPESQEAQKLARLLQDAIEKVDFDLAVKFTSKDALHFNAFVEGFAIRLNR
jgi:hypothetical protein